MTEIIRVFNIKVGDRIGFRYPGHANVIYGDVEKLPESEVGAIRVRLPDNNIVGVFGSEITNHDPAARGIV